MSFIGMFLGGSPGALIASGFAQLNLQWQAQNRQDIAGASFTVTGSGFNQTISASADGRAYMIVPVGEYTVSVTHNGVYNNDEPMTVKAESQKSYVVVFSGTIDIDIINSWSESVEGQGNVPAYDLVKKRFDRMDDAPKFNLQYISGSTASSYCTSRSYGSMTYSPPRPVLWVDESGASGILTSRTYTSVAGSNSYYFLVFAKGVRPGNTATGDYIFSWHKGRDSQGQEIYEPAEPAPNMMYYLIG